MQFLSPSVSATELCTPDTFAHRYRAVLHSLAETSTSNSPDILIVLPASAAKPIETLALYNGEVLSHISVIIEADDCTPPPPPPTISANCFASSHVHFLYFWKISMKMDSESVSSRYISFIYHQCFNDDRMKLMSKFYITKGKQPDTKP